MHRLIITAAAGLAATTLFCAQAQVEPPAIEEYGRLPLIRSVSISPDGQSVAFLRSDEEGDSALIFDRNTGDITGVDTSEVKARSVDFANDDHVILKASETTRTFGFRGEYEYSAAFSFSIAEGNVKQLLAREKSLFPAQSGLGRIVGYLEDGQALMPGYVGDRGDQSPDYDLFRVNLENGRARTFDRGSNDTDDWIVTRGGVVLAREELDQRDDRYTIETKRSGKWETVFELEDTERRPFALVGAKADESALIVIDNMKGDAGSAMFELGFDGAFSKPLFNEPGKEIDQVMMDRYRRVHGVRYSGMRPTYRFFDEDLNKAVSDLLDQYQQLAFSIESWTPDWENIVVRAEGGSESGGYFLFVRSTGELTGLGQSRNIPREAVAAVDTIEYSARDGTPIPALMTWPLNATTRENLPLIVLPHGGPEAYDQLGFDWMAQFFASRGYLVLQPNFRGSSGFGRAFTEAGYGEWGGLMQDDVTDGVDALVKGGYADPGRICIVGASYGGYAALAGGAFTPDLYKCVAAIAPVSDLPRMLIDERRDYGDDHSVVAYWRDVIGDPKDHREKLKAISPVNHAEAFKAPVLLIHGNDDTVVPMRQSARMRSALRRADKPVELIKLKGEDHWLSTAETRLETLKALDAFVNRHIGESSAPAAGAN